MLEGCPAENFEVDDTLKMSSNETGGAFSGQAASGNSQQHNGNSFNTSNGTTNSTHPSFWLEAIIC